jgi:hypothetical protein
MQAGDETVDDETAETEEAVKAALHEAWFMANLMCPNLSDKFWKMCKEAVAPLNPNKLRESKLAASYLPILIKMLPYMHAPNIDVDVVTNFHNQHNINMQPGNPQTDHGIRLAELVWALTSDA